MMKITNITPIKRHLLSTLLAIFSISLYGCGLEENSKISALEQQCKEFSEKTGKNYLPIVGYYLHKRSYLSEQFKEAPGYDHSLILRLNVGNEEITITESIKPEDFRSSYKFIQNILGEDFQDRKSARKMKIGICYYVHCERVNIGNLKTLTKISG